MDTPGLRSAQFHRRLAVLPFRFFACHGYVIWPPFDNRLTGRCALSHNHLADPVCISAILIGLAAASMHLTACRGPFGAMTYLHNVVFAALLEATAAVDGAPDKFAVIMVQPCRIISIRLHSHAQPHFNDSGTPSRDGMHFHSPQSLCPQSAHCA